MGLMLYRIVIAREDIEAGAPGNAKDGFRGHIPVRIGILSCTLTIKLYGNRPRIDSTGGIYCWLGNIITYLLKVASESSSMEARIGDVEMQLQDNQFGGQSVLERIHSSAYQIGSSLGARI